MTGVAHILFPQLIEDTRTGILLCSKVSLRQREPKMRSHIPLVDSFQVLFVLMASFGYHWWWLNRWDLYRLAAHLIRPNKGWPRVCCLQLVGGLNGLSIVFEFLELVLGATKWQQVEAAERIGLVKVAPEAREVQLDTCRESTMVGEKHSRLYSSGCNVGLRFCSRWR